MRIVRFTSSHWTLKIESHGRGFVVTYCYNKLRRHQWLRSWHHDNFGFSVNTEFERAQQIANNGFLLNSSLPGDGLRRRKPWTTLAQAMAWCLTAPSYHLNLVGLSSMGLCGLSHEVIKIWIHNMCLKNTLIQLLLHLSQENELIGEFVIS